MENSAGEPLVKSEAEDKPMKEVITYLDWGGNGPLVLGRSKYDAENDSIVIALDKGSGGDVLRVLAKNNNIHTLLVSVEAKGPRRF